jgi:hypothetical protein
VDYVNNALLQTQTQLNASNNNFATCTDDKAVLQNREGLYNIVLLLAAVVSTILFISNAIGWFMVFKERRKHKEVDE